MTCVAFFINLGNQNQPEKLIHLWNNIPATVGLLKLCPETKILPEKTMWMGPEVNKVRDAAFIKLIRVLF